MLNAIKQFFDEHLAAETEQDSVHDLKLATAALFIEMMQQDHQIRDEERTSVREALKEKFELNDDETRTLFELAERETREATDFHQFTSLIARQYSPEQKIRVIEYLWTVAYSDGHCDPQEEHLVRRIADLIYVPHRDMMKARHKIEKKMQSSDGC